MIPTNLGHLEANQVGCTGKVKESPVLLERRCFRINYSLDKFSSQRSLSKSDLKSQKETKKLQLIDPGVVFCEIKTVIDS